MNESQFSFLKRHLGPNDTEISAMLKTVGANSLDELVSKGMPKEVVNVKKLCLPVALTESEFLQKAREKVSKNKTFKNYIGQGFFECLPLSVTNRNIIKNPCWYTAYTPYQAEISQGRLEALLNFQTLVAEITGMEIANASLLDESSAVTEAISMALNISTLKHKKIFVDQNQWTQTLAVIQTKTESLSIPTQQGSILTDSMDQDVCAVVIQYPFADGSVVDLKKTIQELKEKNIIVIVSTDLLSNCLLQSPKELGADIVIGSTGRLGMPLLYGGPHAAFLATKKEFARLIPGRIVGVSKDRHDQSAFRLSLQTREQHIRRERATSNICTAQVLPAVLASMYVIYHGKKGLQAIAKSIHQQVCYLHKGLSDLGIPIQNHTFFDTLTFTFSETEIQKLQAVSERQQINFGYSKKNQVNISVGEGRSQKDMDEIISIFKMFRSNSIQVQKKIGIPKNLLRTDDFLTHSVFNQYHSENQLIRYIHSLQNKDLTLTHSMIPLGSCTMKLNATTELMPLTWKGFSDIHPFAPSSQVKGSLEIFKELEQFLCEITGFSAVSLQPNAGSQGEYAGLLAFKKYHQFIGQPERNICLIPESAHGTNPASAKIAGLEVVTVRCDSLGDIDSNDLNQKVIKYSKNLSNLMITYPSTCGVFEKHIPKICDLIHQHGGLVYLDGANMNALVGLCQPAQLGADAGHLNLHKTFCIPHGGGGPGVGPLGVVEKLKPFLPTHPFLPTPLNDSKVSLTSAPFGNAGVLSISWAYILMMGFEGLKRASQVAILNANYIKTRLAPYYRILFTGINQQVAHECIVDCRKFQYSADIHVVDIAKRLMDYGFHAPTMSWPVPGTLMIEPTESEDKEEIDRFCEALISIRKEIAEIEEGKVDRKNNVLKNSPHVCKDLIADQWPFSYSKKRAFFPLDYLYSKKFWPSVSRVKEAYGDIHLFCSCPK